MRTNKRTSAERTATELALDATVLPRGAAAIDERLVNAAASEIKKILGNTLAKGMEEVGAYLLEKFYDGDPDLYASASPTKHASLRKLVDKCGTLELPVSATFLSSAIRIAVVSRQLPRGAAFAKLPVSHRVELLRLPTPEKIEEAARDLVGDNRVTVRELRKSVTKMLAKGSPRRGRPRTPPVVRAVNQVASALRKEESWHLAFHRADVDALDEEARAELEQTVERVSALLARLQKLLTR